MLSAYMTEKYDLQNSYVIGDRITDVLLAYNLGAKSIFIKNYDAPDEYLSQISLVADHWKQVYDFLVAPERKILHTHWMIDLQRIS